MSEHAAGRSVAPATIHRAIDILTSVTIEFQRLQRRGATTGSAELDSELARLGVMLNQLGALLVDIRDEHSDLYGTEIASIPSSDDGRSSRDGSGETERFSRA
jgi:hypothetical protein